MFRASDIFGRRPGSVPDKPKVEPKPEDDAPKARTWDAATGQFVEEDLPPEVQAMMRGSKKARVESPPEPLQPPRTGPPAAFAGRPMQQVQQPMPMRLPPAPPPPAPPPPPVPQVPVMPQVERLGNSASPKRLRVVFSGFQKQDLNGQYLEQADQPIQGKASFWNMTRTYFIYWQRSMDRWAICDSGSCQHAKDGSVPGWAYRKDAQHFAKTSDGWMEVCGQQWRPAQVVCTVIEGCADEAQEFSRAGSPELTADQYKALVRQVYTEKNPAKLPDLPGLCSKYEGRERELFEQVCDKYQASFESLVGGVLSNGGQVNQQNGQGNDDEKTLPELDARQYAILVQAVYQKQNPAKLADLARLLQKYRGSEKDFYLQVCEKYGVHPVKFYKEEGEALLVEI